MATLIERSDLRNRAQERQALFQNVLKCWCRKVALGCLISSTAQVRSLCSLPPFSFQLKLIMQNSSGLLRVYLTARGYVFDSGSQFARGHWFLFLKETTPDVVFRRAKFYTNCRLRQGQPCDMSLLSFDMLSRKATCFPNVSLSTSTITQRRFRQKRVEESRENMQF